MVAHGHCQVEAQILILRIWIVIKVRLGAEATERLRQPRLAQRDLQVPVSAPNVVTNLNERLSHFIDADVSRLARLLRLTNADE